MNYFIIPKKYLQKTRIIYGTFNRTSIVLLLIVFMFFPNSAYSANILQQQFQLSILMKTKMPIASVDVINTYPHDTEAFTQGFCYHQGYLYESTGIYGRSSLYKKDVKTGKNLQEVKIFQDYFGEGIAILKKKIYQLTWQNETVIIYDAKTFKEIGKIKYRGEGWGLTSDGRHLLMSNGSSSITFRDPDSFQVIREIRVHDGDAAIGRLNELEFIKGEIWANIFMEDLIVRISPKTGKVTGWINLSSLRSYLPSHAEVDVLNGIAYDTKADRIFVTGKFWPKVFEIQLSK